MIISRSREGAWIEINAEDFVVRVTQGRSREGAWIEMRLQCRSLRAADVAPVRERGLKYRSLYHSSNIHRGRSREGAWIEM